MCLSPSSSAWVSSICYLRCEIQADENQRFPRRGSAPRRRPARERGRERGRAAAGAGSLRGPREVPGPGSPRGPRPGLGAAGRPALLPQWGRAEMSVQGTAAWAPGDQFSAGALR